MLLVGEVHGVAAGLLRLIAAGEVGGQIRQGQHGRGHGRQIFQMLRLGGVEGGGQLFQRVLAPLHHGLKVLLFGVLALDGAHAAEGGMDGRHGLPVPPGGG